MLPGYANCCLKSNNGITCSYWVCTCCRIARYNVSSSRIVPLPAAAVPATATTSHKKSKSADKPKHKDKSRQKEKASEDEGALSNSSEDSASSASLSGDESSESPVKPKHHSKQQLKHRLITPLTDSDVRICEAFLCAWSAREQGGCSVVPDKALSDQPTLGSVISSIPRPLSAFIQCIAVDGSNWFVIGPRIASWIKWWNARAILTENFRPLYSTTQLTDDWLIRSDAAKREWDGVSRAYFMIPLVVPARGSAPNLSTSTAPTFSRCMYCMKGKVFHAITECWDKAADREPHKKSTFHSAWLAAHPDPSKVSEKI